MQTPWGWSQSADQYGEGIVFHSTASHGGFIVAPAQNAIIHPAWRNADGVYEEDCEAGKVIVTFPDRFPAGTVKNAHKSNAHWFPVPYKAVFPKGAPL